MTKYVIRCRFPKFGLDGCLVGLEWMIKENQSSLNGSKSLQLFMWWSKDCISSSISSTKSMGWKVNGLKMKIQKDCLSHQTLQHGKPLDRFLERSFWSFPFFFLWFKAFMRLPEMIDIVWSSLFQTTRMQRKKQRTLRPTNHFCCCALSFIKSIVHFFNIVHFFKIGCFIHTSFCQKCFLYSKLLIFKHYNFSISLHCTDIAHYWFYISVLFLLLFHFWFPM